MVVWTGFPFIAVTVLAGLRTIPSELLESARVDGAGPWRIFWQVTYPLLRPIFQVLVLLSVIWDFGVFTQVYIIIGELGQRDEYNLGIYEYARRSRCRRPTAWPPRRPSSSRSSCSSSRSATSGPRSRRGRCNDDPVFFAVRGAFGAVAPVRRRRRF